MSDPISTAGIYGSDGKTPIYNPEARFSVWSKSELFMGMGTGSPGENRYVPKVGDLVIDMDLFLHYRVVGVNAATLVPQLQEMTPIRSGGEMTDEDLLLGVGPGTQSDTYRIYLDKSVIPYALAVDARLTVAGTMVSYARIFRGADLTQQGHVVSGFYDPAGNLLGNSIPLELVVMPGGVNTSIKTVPVCYTMENLPDGEVVTAVFYSDAGHVVSKRQLLVENTAFIRSANLSTKYITDISLECPFLSSTDQTLINLPINVLLSGVNMMGVVHYSDGSTVRMPVDGGKFALLGMEGYIATVVNQQVPLVLRYRLSPDEVIYGAGIGEFAHKSKNYRVKTAQADGSYSVKLYGYPVWRNAIDGYRMQWFLYNGDRNVTYDVTGLVEYSSSGAAFNPLAYGVNQRLTVAVNLQSVNGAYRDYRHVQTMDVILWGPGTDRDDSNWTIAFDIGQNPVFGENNHGDLRFINANLYHLNIGLGAANIDEWLDRLYYRTKPLIDQFKEQVPPRPTHFRLRFGTFDLDYQIEQWNETHVIGNGLSDNGTLFVEFIKRTPLNDIQLSVAGLPLWQQI